MAACPEPCVIAVPEALLHDLRQRLALTRWSDEMPGSGWHYGANLAYAKELVHYWQHQYDWHAQERLLNGFPQYRRDRRPVSTLHDGGPRRGALWRAGGRLGTFIPGRLGYAYP